METWRKVFRVGIAPELSRRQLEALRDGLCRDDARILQGATTCPPPMQCVLDWDCEGACPLGYAAWQGSEMTTVGEVEKWFVATCFKADQRLEEPAAIRYFLNWADDTPRDEMRLAMLAESRDP